MENKRPKKQALCIASVASNLDNFSRDNVNILQRLGYEVTLAANFHSKEDINSQEKIDAFAKEMRAKKAHVVDIDFTRNPKKIRMLIRSVRQVSRILKRRFDLVHCHSPICAAIVRIEAIRHRRKHGMRVFYTAHGFHFYKGAPLQNWLLYYPVEWLCSWWTDVLITINKEDYHRAKKGLHAGKTVYVPGIGIDLEKFHSGTHTGANKRKELGLESSDIMLLSVGELRKRKNHEAVIRAIYELENPDVKYFICGIGALKSYLISLIQELRLEEQVKLLGYRTDISELCQAADLFVFPSLREGLPVALMEAIACKTPVVCSRIRGNTDLVLDNRCLFDGKDIKSLVDVLKWSVSNRKDTQATMKKIVCRNYEHLKRYEKKTVCKKMEKVFTER